MFLHEDARKRFDVCGAVGKARDRQIESAQAK
jgi:hypothetical protein